MRLTVTASGNGAFVAADPYRDEGLTCPQLPAQSLICQNTAAYRLIPPGRGLSFNFLVGTSLNNGDPSSSAMLTLVAEGNAGYLVATGSMVQLNNGTSWALDINSGRPF